MGTGFVLQEDVLTYEMPLNGVLTKGDYPKTVIMAGGDTSMLRTFGRADLLDRLGGYPEVEPRKAETYHFAINKNGNVIPSRYIYCSSDPRDEKAKNCGFEIPPEIALAYGLTEGDSVGYVVDHNNKLMILNTINGCSDPRKIQTWPRDLSRFQSDYPKRPFLVEKYGDFDLRVMTLLAPIGLGASYWVIAPGGTGKTWLQVKILEAALKLTQEDDSQYIIMGYVGDRPEDEAQYRDVFARNPLGRGEMHAAPWNCPPDSQVDVARFVMNRAKRLTAIGKHVVVLFDSISRVVAAHTASSYVNSDSGMISGGIYRDSLTEVIGGIFGTHGSFGGNRSLTIIGTVLASDGVKKTSEAAVDQETSDSSTTAMTRLVRIPTLERPWISVNEGETYTRFPDGRDFRSDAQRKEMETVQQLMRGGDGKNNSYLAHAALLRYARSHPIPLYV